MFQIICEFARCTKKSRVLDQNPAFQKNRENTKCQKVLVWDQNPAFQKIRENTKCQGP